MNTKIAVFALLALSAVAFAAAEEGSENVLKLTAESYDEAVNDGKLYFVKFFAPWCGHCKRLAPTWNDLAGELKSSDKIVVAHVDCTTDKEVCSRAEVRGYPTLYAIHDGELKEKYSGARDLHSLKSWIVGKSEKL